MSEDVELELPQDAQYVGLARLAVTAVARQAGMDPARLEDLRLAVSEATTNAMRGRREENGSPEPVVLAFGPRGESGFAVTITGGGPGFEPPRDEAAEHPEWADEDGLGVTLIRGLADEVEFVRGTGSRSTMRFEVSMLPESGLDEGGSTGGNGARPDQRADENGGQGAEGQ